MGMLGKIRRPKVEIRKKSEIRMGIVDCSAPAPKKLAGTAKKWGQKDNLCFFGLRLVEFSVES
jgi:hypothetical protein